jgi:hypothetical protein
MAGYKPYIPGHWRSSSEEAVVFDRDDLDCPALRRWGPGTQAVIEAALRRIDELEEMNSNVRSASGRSVPAGGLGARTTFSTE